MRNFEKLDENSLRAFYFAAETLNFTKAAEMAALTQSGISQHVSRLEQSLDVSLFLRANKKVQLTEAGHKLKRYVETYLDQVDGLLEEFRKEAKELKGRVRYAMPNSCLMTPHFPLLLEKQKEFDQVDLKVTICHSPQVIEMLVSGEIDFGFVTSKLKHNEVEFLEFGKEEYVLVSANKADLSFKSLADLKEMNFINYPGMDELFEKWQNEHYPRSNKLILNDVHISGEINNLNGAITMTLHGLGIGIFPSHCVQSYLNSGQLKKFKTSSHLNSIYIVKIKTQKATARVQKVLDTFWDMVRSANY
jgi:LysR family transcriptional regulator, transcriptional activator of the cysJI operon